MRAWAGAVAVGLAAFGAGRATAPQGVREEALSAAQADAPTLDADQLRQIVELVLSVSHLRGRPQDIEWGIQGGKLYLHIVPSPWNNASTGSYRVRISAGSQVDREEE